MEIDEPIKFTVVGRTVDDAIAFELDTLVFSTDEEAIAMKIAKLVDERKLRLYLTVEDAKNEVKSCLSLQKTLGSSVCTRTVATGLQKYHFIARRVLHQPLM